MAHSLTGRGRAAFPGGARSSSRGAGPRAGGVILPALPVQAVERVASDFTPVPDLVLRRIRLATPVTASVSRTNLRVKNSKPRPPSLEVAVTERSRRWRESIEAYESELERDRITVRHRRECVRVARNVGDLLERAGLACDPRFFGDAHLTHLLNGPWRGLKPNGKAYNVCLLGRYLKRSDNLTVERARLRFDRTPQRPKLALSLPERVRLLDTARRFGIVHYGMVVLMLTMGLRPSEVRRITVEQATSDPLVFIGKRKGIEQGFGKVRRVPPHPLFRELFPELLAHRQQVVAESHLEDPGFLFCHVWKGKLSG